MRRGSTAGWKSWQGRRRCLLLVIVAVVAAAGSALAEDEAPVLSPAEIDEIDREIAELDEAMRARASTGEGPGPASKAGTVICGDDYLEGKYEDIVAYFEETDVGQPTLRVKAEFEACLAASSHNCSRDTYFVLKGSWQNEAWRHAVLSRWNARLLAAEALGHDVRLKWKQSNFSGWNVCILERLVVWSRPTSGQ